MARIFISHAASDRREVRRLMEALRRAGHQPWILDDELVPGESPRAALERRLGDSDWAIFSLSRATLGDAVNELALDLARKRLPRERILAVRLDRVEAPKPLAQAQAFDLIGSDWDRGARLLVEALTGGARLPGVPDRAPAAFVGRQEELQRLQEVLTATAETGAAPPVASIVASAGMGKTTLASVFAKTSAERFPGGVWWVHANVPPVEALNELLSDLKARAPLAARALLDRVPETANAEQRARAAIEALSQQQEPALLVLDDVESAEWQPWLESLSSGALRVLMTTDFPELAKGRVVALRPLSRKDTRTLVEKLSPRPTGWTERRAQRRVLAQTQGVPLTATMVGNTVAAEGSWAEVARSVEALPKETLAVFIDRFLERVRPAALRVLRAMSVFAHHPIPVSWVEAAAGQLAGTSFEGALNELTALGVATTDEPKQTVTLHPLISGQAWDRMNPDERRELVERAAEHVEEWFDARLLERNQAELEAGRAHLEKLLELVDPFGSPDLWVRLALQRATGLLLRGKHAEARQAYEAAITPAEKAAPGSLITALLGAARAAKRLGDDAGAEQQLQRAQELVEAMSKTGGPQYANLLSALASVLLDSDPRAALPYARRALELAEAQYPPGSEQVFERTALLAKIIEKLEGVGATQPVWERLWRSLLGAGQEESSVLAGVLSSMAVSSAAAGDLAQARKFLERAVPIYERTPGQDIPLASTLEVLGLVLFNLGEYEASEGALRDAERVIEKARGADDPRLRTTRSLRSALAQARGDAAAAAHHLERALDVGLTLYEPVAGDARDELDKALRLARGRDVNSQAFSEALQQAITAAERARDIRNGARAALLLGAYEGQRGAWEPARQHLEHGLKLAGEADEARLIAEGYRLLGDACLHGSRYEDARLNYAEAIRRYDELGFANKARKARVLLVTMLVQLGQVDGLQAHERALEQALKDQDLTDADERRDIEQALRLLAEFRRSRGEEGGERSP